MKEFKSNEEKHDLEENKNVNKLLANIGIGLSIFGILLIIISMLTLIASDMSSSPMGSFLGFFIGMVFTAIGQFLFQTFGAGRKARFFAKQTAPVKKDVLKYMIDETGEDISKVIRDAKGNDLKMRACLKCGAINPITNKYCGDCGNKIVN